MKQNEVQFIVNGNEARLEVAPGEMLADVLRYRLGLTGTKIGCNEAECGSCTVLIDGEPVLSCSYPAMKADGKQILTIEGLAVQAPKTSEASTLHPLQEAFIQYGAVQCGFCIPGQLMTSYALLCHNSDPSEADIKAALKDTLCRCAGYPTIIKSVQEAARVLRTGDAVRPVDVEPSSQQHQFCWHPSPAR